MNAASVAAAWWDWIAPLSVQIALLAVVFAIAERTLLRRAPVAVRAAFAWAFLARLALPPDLASPVALVRLLGDAPAAAQTADASGTGTAALAALWFTGVLVATACAARRWRTDRSDALSTTRAAPAALVRRADELARTIGLRRAPAVRVADVARGPLVVGLLRPIVVVPARAAHAGGARLDHVLLHELAHVARRDTWSSFVWTTARIVFWFHPAVHWSARHAATLREIACDARAAHAAADPAQYRSTLLAHARELVEPRALAVAHFGPARAEILSRLAALDARVSAPERSLRARETAAALLAFTLLCACVVPLARTHAAATIPAQGELEGCLRQRYAVLAALAAESNTATDP